MYMYILEYMYILYIYGYILYSKCDNHYLGQLTKMTNFNNSKLTNPKT